MDETDIISRTFNTLDPKPVRAWSLIATVYGDCVLPRGGGMWLGTLTEILGALGVEPGSVRAAVSRLARQGFLLRTRIGRTSHYALSDTACALSRDAERIIYRTTPPPPPANWDFALAPRADRRARDLLLGAGYRTAGGTTYVRPGLDAPRPHAPGVLHFNAYGDDAALAAQLYNLDDVRARYGAFLKACDILQLDADKIGGVHAVSRRLALVHGFRRAVLRDPGLPLSARPNAWPATDAYARFAEIYRLIAPASEVWLAATMQGASTATSRGPIQWRFADDQTTIA